MSGRPLPAALGWAVALGWLTEAQAHDANAFCDGLEARVASGELTREQAFAAVDRHSRQYAARRAP